MKVRNEVLIEKNADNVWEVMGKQFDRIHEWASFFVDAKPAGEAKFEGINFSARETVVGSGKNTHTLDVFDSENHILSYTVTAGAPPFAEKAEAEWALEIMNENTCKASIEVNMVLKDMIPAEKGQEVQQWLSQSADDMLEELKHFTETGTLHPRKLNA